MTSFLSSKELFDNKKPVSFTLVAATNKNIFHKTIRSYVHVTQHITSIPHSNLALLPDSVTLNTVLRVSCVVGGSHPKENRIELLLLIRKVFRQRMDICFDFITRICLVSGTCISVTCLVFDTHTIFVSNLLLISSPLVSIDPIYIRIHHMCANSVTVCHKPLLLSRWLQYTKGYCITWENRLITHAAA